MSISTILLTLALFISLIINIIKSNKITLLNERIQYLEAMNDTLSKIIKLINKK